MSRSYSHSNTFGSLKGIKEGITHNLTSYQYLHTLDYLLYRAIALIYEACPSFVLNYLAKVIAHQALKPAIKFSRNEKSTLPSLFFNLATKGSMQGIENLNLNRGLLFGLIAQFLNIVNTYRLAADMRLSVSANMYVRVERQTKELLGVEPEFNLHRIMREVEYWEEKAHWFKALITQKYVRMALLQAQSTYKELAHSVSLSDVSQIYLMYVSKAIDRCDSRQGVLTTFIQSWLKSAKAEAAVFAKESLHSSYEELVENGSFAETTLPDSIYEELQHIAHVAKQFDREGYLRASLGIPEFVAPNHRAVLMNFIPE